MTNIIAVDFTRYSSDPAVAPETFLTVDAARDFLSSLKCRPHGVLEVTFDIDDDDDGLRLAGTMLTRNSDEYDWNAEYDDDSGNDYISQTFSLLLGAEQWRSRQALIDEAGRLICGFMAHEALEWLRFEDGAHLHEPHPDGRTRTAV